MTQPSVNATELDGALGVLPPTSGRLFAIVGPATSGPLNTPATFARVRDVQATFGAGPLVEAAAHYIDRYGRPVLLVRTATTDVATVSAVDAGAATGTSVVTVGDDSAVDDFELQFKVVTGGTIGVAGITYQVSLDAGRSWTPTLALGTAASAALADSGVTLDFAAGTLVAGDVYKAEATGPMWQPADLTAPLNALRNTLASWELALVCGPVDQNAFDVIEPAFTGMAAAGKHHAWVGNTRIPATGETEAAYLTALSPLSAAKSSKHGSLYSGGCKFTSSVSGRKYRRPVAIAAAAREAASSEEVNTADFNLGPLPGVSIRDVNGNADEHDESINPGLDDLRFAVLSTADGYPGVYINRPRLFSPEGSDFQLMPHRRVLNLVHDVLRVYFLARLNRPVIVSRATGFILESEALEIELGALAVMRSALLAKPKASDVLFALSRTDNLLSTKTMTGQGRVLPLAYPEFINLDLGYYNPALQLDVV